MTANRIFGPFFFEDPASGKAVTVNTERYVSMLDEIFDEKSLSELCGYYFQEDVPLPTSLRTRWLLLSEASFLRD